MRIHWSGYTCCQSPMREMHAVQRSPTAALCVAFNRAVARFESGHSNHRGVRRAGGCSSWKRRRGTRTSSAPAILEDGTASGAHAYVTGGCSLTTCESGICHMPDGRLLWLFDLQPGTLLRYSDMLIRVSMWFLLLYEV